MSVYSNTVLSVFLKFNLKRDKYYQPVFLSRYEINIRFRLRLNIMSVAIQVT